MHLTILNNNNNNKGKKNPAERNIEKTQKSYKHLEACQFLIHDIS